MKNIKKKGLALTFFLLVIALSCPPVYATNKPAEDFPPSQNALFCLINPQDLPPVDIASAEIAPVDQTLSLPPTLAAEATAAPDEENPKSDGFILYDIPLSKELQRYTFDLSKSYGMDYRIVLAVMYVESKFESSTRSKNTNGTVDSGLMQVNSGYKKWQASIADIPLKDYDVTDSYDNIRVGIAELAYARDHWAQQGITGEKLDLYMLNSYNMGIGGYTKYVKGGNLSRSYDRKVMSYLKTLLPSK